MTTRQEAEIYWPARGEALRAFVRWIRWGFKPMPQMVKINGQRHVVGRLIERGPTIAIFRGRQLAAWWKIEGDLVCTFVGTHHTHTRPLNADDEIVLSDGGIYKVARGAEAAHMLTNSDKIDLLAA